MDNFNGTRASSANVFQALRTLAVVLAALHPYFAPYSCLWGIVVRGPMYMGAVPKRKTEEKNDMHQ